MSESAKVTGQNGGRFGKGNPGKPKGAVTKNTKALKDMILGALEQAGGQEYLLRCAQDEKLAGPFLTLIGKVLPTTLQGPGPNGEHVFQRIVREVVDCETKGQ